MFQKFDSTFDLRQAAWDAGLPVAPASTPIEMMWVDIETTGLDVKKDIILEVGMVGTTRTGEVIDGAFKHAYPRISRIDHLPEVVNPFVKKMHDDSGLWDDLTSAFYSDAAEDDLETVFAEWWSEHDLAVDYFPMCGSSIQFDRNFLAAHAPAVEALFHYRNIDISTLKGIAALVAPSVTEIEWTNQKRHRVISDCLDSIVEYRHYLRYMISTDEMAESANV